MLMRASPQAIHAIGQLALDLGGTVAKKVPNFQKAVNKQVIEAIPSSSSGRPFIGTVW